MPHNYTLLNRYSTYGKDYIKYFENENDSLLINESAEIKNFITNYLIKIR